MGECDRELATKPVSNLLGLFCKRRKLRKTVATATRDSKCLHVRDVCTFYEQGCVRAFLYVGVSVCAHGWV